MLDLIGIVLIIFFAGVAFFKENDRLRIAVMIALVAILIIREISIPIYASTELGASQLRGLMLEHFQDGAHALLSYCYNTYYYIGPTYIILIIIVIRGCRQSLSKRQLTD
jgi:hypothetical protein